MVNLLPYDGIVHYVEDFSLDKDLIFYFKTLYDEVRWCHDEVKIYGKTIITKRMVAWYGDFPYEYNYSKISRKALFWNPTLLELRESIETLLGERFNSCLLNLYPDGNLGMGWHRDNEPELENDGIIASLSLGEPRRFLFKHKSTNERIEILLKNGSLLIMKGCTQRFWYHQLPKMRAAKGARINLTFRKIIQLGQ